jgi:hypothetical protein
MFAARRFGVIRDSCEPILEERWGCRRVRGREGGIVAEVATGGSLAV